MSDVFVTSFIHEMASAKSRLFYVVLSAACAVRVTGSFLDVAGVRNKSEHEFNICENWGIYIHVLVFESAGAILHIRRDVSHLRFHAGFDI